MLSGNLQDYRQKNFKKVFEKAGEKLETIKEESNFSNKKNLKRGMLSQYTLNSCNYFLLFLFLYLFYFDNKAI